MPDEAQMTPQQHAQHISQMIRDAQQECYSDVARVQDPQGKVVLEKVAEILGSAITILVDYQNGKEPIWRRGKAEQTAEAETHQKEYAPPTTTEFSVDIEGTEPPTLVSEMPREE